MSLRFWHNSALIHVVCLKAAAAYTAAQYDTGGDFENDPYAPSVLPQAPTEWFDLGGLADALPVDGDFYGHQLRRQNDPRGKVPWVEVSLPDRSDARLVDTGDAASSANLSHGDRVLIQIDIRARVGVDSVVGANSRHPLTRVLGMGQARSLCRAARHAIADNFSLLARTLDPTAALGAYAVTRVEREAYDPSGGVAPAEGQDAHIFDATASLFIQQSQPRAIGTVSP